MNRAAKLAAYRSPFGFLRRVSERTCAAVRDARAAHSRGTTCAWCVDQTPSAQVASSIIVHSNYAYYDEITRVVNVE